MRVLFLILSASALLLSGCKGPCRQLSEKLCDCTDNSFERDACVRQAAEEESRVSPTAEDEERCEALLETCDCTRIQTAEGKIACGLAKE